MYYMWVGSICQGANLIFKQKSYITTSPDNENHNAMHRP